MSGLFSSLSNSFTTHVGQKIEEATDSGQASENWSLILEICDIINGTDDGAKDAVRAIRKRLQQNANKNYKTVLFTLTLLEACVKNCDRRFHVLVCSKDFVQELFKLIDPRNDAPVVVQEKVLSLIQSWADAFRNQPEMSPVVRMYRDLKMKGIEFPMTDLDAMAPIHTPRKTVTQNQMSHVPQSGDQATISPNHGPSSDYTDGMIPNSAEIDRLNPEQLAKLRQELNIVDENMTVLNELLSGLVPGQEHPSDLELLTQLHSTCKTMQSRLVELISQLSNDDVTAELLRINDLLNNLFLRYSRYEKNRIPPASYDVGKETAALIDLGPIDENEKATSVASGSTVHDVIKSETPPIKPTDFDMFAQSRGVTYESSKKTGSSYEDNLKPDLLSGGLASITLSRSQPPSMDPILGMHRESDFDEMAAWLQEQGSSGGPDSITSSEFDRFLSERAAAAENLPARSQQRSSNNSENQSSTAGNTASHRSKYTSKDMYAL